jgi:hypothetical protein
VGLISDAAVERAHNTLFSALEASLERRISLEQAGELVSSALGTPNLDVEAIVQLWPEFALARPSLFEAFLKLA